MEIKDYLHFYIGCLCKVDYISENFQAFTGLRVGDEDVHISPQIYVLVNDNLIKVKPILRKLSDMTEKELRQCIKLKEGGRLRENQPLHRRVRTNDMNDTFTQWYYEDFNGLRKVNETIVANLSDDENGLSLIDTNNYYRCHLKVIPFLLKQGFDLFGLCDAGLAIDNKSI